MRILIVLILACACLGGCYLVKVDFSREMGDISIFTPDVSTYEDVLDAWGAPLGVSKAGDGFCFIYGHVNFDDSIFAIKEPITSMNFASDRTDRRFFMDYLLFNKQGVLEEIIKFDRKTRLGGGTSLRPRIDDPLAEFFANNPIENPWGRALLQPLTRTLNYHNTLRYGENGTEIFGTPTGVGQNTLERPQ